MAEISILTGIDPEVLEELRRGEPRTILVGSAQNLMSLLEASLGDYVLVTARSARDLVPGVEGLVTRVMAKEVTMHRHTHRSGLLKEEHEAAVAQVQLEAEDEGRLLRVTETFNELPIRGDVDLVPGEVPAF